MDDEVEKIRERLQQETEAEDKRLYDLCRSKLDDRELQNIWTFVRGGDSSQKPKNTLSNLFEILRIRILLPTATAVGILLFVLWPSSFTRNPDGNLGAKVRLPEKLKINFETWSVKISGDGAELTGTLTASPTESTAEAAVFHLDLRGKDSTGTEAILTNGLARIVRKTPNTPIKNEKDVREIFFSGTLQLKGVGDFPISDESYRP